MKTKDLIEIKETLVELWDFFTSNSDGDETGLVQGLEDKYSNSLKAVRKELDSNYLKSEVAKLVRHAKKEQAGSNNNMMIELNTFSNNKSKYSIDDITTWIGKHNRSGYNFSIEKFSEKLFSEEDAKNLETFINDEPNDNFADQFNLEYMSFLTGEFKGTKEELIILINLFLK